MNGRFQWPVPSYSVKRAGFLAIHRWCADETVFQHNNHSLVFISRIENSYTHGRRITNTPERSTVFPLLWAPPLSAIIIYASSSSVIGFWSWGASGAILSKFFIRFWLAHEVWPQISGRDLEDREARSWRFLPEICGQTPAVFQAADFQQLTEVVQKRPVLSNIFTSFYLRCYPSQNRKKRGAEHFFSLKSAEFGIKAVSLPTASASCGLPRHRGKINKRLLLFGKL